MKTVKDYIFNIKIGTIVTCLIFLVGFVFSTVSIYKGIEYKIEKIETKQIYLVEKNNILNNLIEKNANKLHENDIILTEIRTKLINIESILIGIQSEFKK